MNHKNVENIKNWPMPKSIKDVEKIFRFFNYHHEHTQNYARDTLVVFT